MVGFYTVCGNVTGNVNVFTAYYYKREYICELKRSRRAFNLYKIFCLVMGEKENACQTLAELAELERTRTR